MKKTYNITINVTLDVKKREDAKRISWISFKGWKHGVVNKANRFIETDPVIKMTNENMKHIGSTGLWVVEQGIHTDRFYNSLRHMVDGILEMRFEEDKELKRFIRMHTFKGINHNTSWKPFSISKEGTVEINQ